MHIANKPGSAIDFDQVENTVVPDDGQTTCKVRKAFRNKLKVISALSNKTVFTLVDSRLAEFVRRYEATIGRPVTPDAGGANVISLNADSVSEATAVPEAELTTIRISKDRRGELKLIAKREGITLFVLIDMILTDSISQFEVAAGVTLPSK
jgi:hypothetical protein